MEIRGAAHLLGSLLSRLAVTDELSSASEHTEERSEPESEATPGGISQSITSNLFMRLAVTSRQAV